MLNSKYSNITPVAVVAKPLGQLWLLLAETKLEMIFFNQSKPQGPYKYKVKSHKSAIINVLACKKKSSLKSYQ
jgi:hypothetical protein